MPFADGGPTKVDDRLTDEQVLFLSDITPTGYMGADMCDIGPGHTVAVWGAGPVGLLAAASALMLGAERVAVIDRFPHRLRMGADGAGATDIMLDRIHAGDVDPAFIITHRLPLGQAPQGHEILKQKQDDCVTVVLTPCAPVAGVTEQTSPAP